ncbi:NUDIX domain-containing protein [Halobacterium yunchengense]|uniref:NUDIX domain-containing protein n=1 Tax=Halobacterium yunchengense TaxID=3108497 RepID=UPI0030082A94
MDTRETIEETATREVHEETDFECTVVDANFAPWETIVLESNLGERYYMLTVVLDARYEGGTIAVCDEEILEVKWFSESLEKIERSGIGALTKG